jgi:DNA processing protein
MSLICSADFISAALCLAFHDALNSSQRMALARSVSDPTHARLKTPPRGCQLSPVVWEAWLKVPAHVTEWVQASSNWLDANDEHQLLSFWDPAYPQTLRELPSPPMLLFLLGDVSLLNDKGIAMVGSRGATLSGKRRARDFSAELAKKGWTIISGLAKGIDSAAHVGALQVQGRTIAVLGCGVDVVYPTENSALYENIQASGGLLVSEYPPGTPPRPVFFPRRNRLIAALCKGLVVIEAATRSGSLITANIANDLGKSVMAIPGSIDSPQARGCHQAIRAGATLVETIQDIEQEVLESEPNQGRLKTRKTRSNPGGKTLANEQVSTTDPLSAQVLSLLQRDPQQLDLLIEATGCTPEDLSVALCEMELQGQIEARPGQYWAMT